MKHAAPLAIATISVAIFFAIFYLVLSAALPAAPKFFLALIVLSGCGHVLAKIFSFESHLGIFLVRSRLGLGLIDSLAKKHSALWEKFAQIGMVVGYGSLAYFMMNEKLNWRKMLFTYGIGVFLLVLISSLIPIGMSVLLSMVKGGSEFAEAGAKLQIQTAQFEQLKILSLIFMVVGGVALMTAASVVLYGLIVFGAVLQALMGNVSVLKQTSPGGMPIIPGINLDLFQGLVALAIVLAIHEGMHGILARAYKMKLKSAGLVFFGFVPLGAFVDIDEKSLLSQRKERQNAVLIAGTAGNFAVSLVFFALLFAAFLLFGSLPSEIGQSSWVVLFLRIVALSFAINIIVASVNLLPIPMFDGHHLLKNMVGDSRISSAISYLVVLSFLLTLSPWLLR
ncbi:MAG: site-2 protease family protein [Candidatus Micrarchaeota archaeon]|nr:site-2 protease family protein [Candidatus Micrarchaeota archaeon]